MTLLVGCYPGSFNPPTIAHLAVAEAAVAAAGLHRLDLVISRVALGKGEVAIPSLDDRLSVLHAVAASRPWLGVMVTDHQLVVDIAAGYDAVVMGADKWRQVTDPAWYAEAEAVSDADGAAARDAAVAALPRVLVVPRAGDRPATSHHHVEVLEVGVHLTHVAASAVRAGAPGAEGWMLPEAAALDARTGAWTDPARYRATGGSSGIAGAAGAGPEG